MVLNWFKPYLDSQGLYAKHKSKKSSLFLLNNCVHQGSILGPVVFTLYTNDLIKSNNLYMLFTDDSVMSGKIIDEIIKSLILD